MIHFKGKRGVVLGAANKRSIAAAVAEEVSQLGAELFLTYGPDPKGRFRGYVEQLAAELSGPGRYHAALPCDVQKDSDITALFESIAGRWPEGIDFIVHSVAYAERDDLERPFSDTSRRGWQLAQDVSAYSLLPLCAKGAPLMRKRGGGSVVCMTFIGSMLAVPNYHVMGPAKAALESAVRYLARELGDDGIRCNAVSAGALRTLSSSGIRQFGKMLKVADQHSALQRNVTPKEVAQTVAFMLSDGASGITGQSIYVDAGYQAMAN